jgi:hypothetical protein
MVLGRKVPAFTAIARASLCEALAASSEPSPVPTLDGQSAPPDTLVAHLSHGDSLRGAARAARLNRPAAKQALRMIARAAADFQADAFAALAPASTRHRAAWAFSEKPRDGATARLDRSDRHSVWTHVWSDDETQLVRQWLVGPSPPFLSRQNERTAPPEEPLIRFWRSGRPSGLLKKIDLHAQALAFFVMHHNFCRTATGSRTPAMLSGVADRAWTPSDIAALAFDTCDRVTA